jgi:hypothetical protein
MSLALSDSQVAQILLTCRPLQPKERTAFIAELFLDLIMRRGEVGDGELGRTWRELQRKHFQPPSDHEVSAAKHSYY